MRKTARQKLATATISGRLGTTLAVGGKTMAADAEASARPSKTLRANKRKAKLKAKHRSPASPSDCLDLSRRTSRRYRYQIVHVHDVIPYGQASTVSVELTRAPIH